ncbi:MAG: trimethylamine methyltransferase family protein, partial [Alphaproteobacteria bacterium]
MARVTSRRRARRQPAGPVQLPWRRLRNPYKPIEVLSADQIEAIHEASLRVLEELGIDIWSDTALEVLARAGADVDREGRHVRLDRGLVAESIAHAPAEFTLTPRNPARAITMGGDHVNFGLVGGPAHSTDLDRGRRSGVFADTCDLIRLSQCLEVLHLVGGGPVAPTDLPVATRHLETCRACITLTDKVWQSTAFGSIRVDDAIDMLCIARRTSRERLAREPGAIGNVNCNSPLRYDEPMLEGLMALARARQPVIVTPFTLAGAMSPVTLAGALAQQNAEALAGIALAQLVNPGTPVMYGGFTSNVDMKTGAPAFGTPEYMKAALVGGQLARRYGIPYRSSNACAANAVDSQSGYESVFSLWGAIMGGANLVMHGAGWMEGGLHASVEKMVVDADLLQMVAAFLDPVIVDDATMAVEAIAEVGPGGHFFGVQHTQDRYRDAFFRP